MIQVEAIDQVLSRNGKKEFLTFFLSLHNTERTKDKNSDHCYSVQVFLPFFPLLFGSAGICEVVADGSILDYRSTVS